MALCSTFAAYAEGDVGVLQTLKGIIADMMSPTFPSPSFARWHLR